MAETGMIKAGWFFIILGLSKGFCYEDPKPFEALERLACQEIVLGALDKITAKVTELVLKRGELSSFGPLRIIVHQCWKSQPEDPPETLAFIEINELKPNRSLVPVFAGWMFASHPSVSALEHPVYDVWVKDGVIHGSTLPQPVPLQPPILPEKKTVETEEKEDFIDPEASPETIPEADSDEDAIAALYRGLDRPQVKD